MGNRSSNCIFCDIRDRKNQKGQEPFYQDDEVFAFEDINVASSQRHILICPIKHIKNVNSLTHSDIQLVQKLERIGNQILEQSHPNNQYRFGYHVPPFNSVNHLHLHGFVLPISNCIYNNISYGCFLKSNQSIIRKLENISSRL